MSNICDICHARRVDADDMIPLRACIMRWVAHRQGMITVATLSDEELVSSARDSLKWIRADADDLIDKLVELGQVPRPDNIPPF